MPIAPQINQQTTSKTSELKPVSGEQSRSMGLAGNADCTKKAVACLDAL
jgi:hypothetical protein